MFKRVFLLGLIGLLLVVTSVYAEVKPNCELGDAIFRPVNYPLISGFEHTGIYCCSQSNKGSVTIGTEDPYPIQIKDSDFKHSVIQANGYNPPPGYKQIDFDTLDVALADLTYWGAYNSGTLDAKQRRQIVATAYKQIGYDYATGDPKREIYGRPERPEDIKKPGASFRCDGLVEYCYEVIKYRGIDSSGNPCDNYGFFSSWEEKNCWLTLTPGGIVEALWAAFFVKKDACYPKALMARMKESGGKQVGKPPQILIFKLYKEANEIKEGGLLKKNDVVTIKPYVTDLDNGSGIDRVDLYYQELFIPGVPPPGKGTLTLITTLDDDEDIGKEYSYDWIVPETFITFGNCELSAVAYDRAGNTIGTASKFWTGSPYHVKEPFRIIIDNIPPQVTNTAPTNGATKIYIGKRIRVTFSEEMDKETINDGTILVNGGSVVGSITYAEDLRTAFFVPEKPLNINTNYTVLVKSGATGVKDKAGNPMNSDYPFSFTTTDELTPGRVIEVPVTYTDEYGNEHPVPAGTRVMSSYWLEGTTQETYIIGPSKWQGVEEDGKVRFNWPGGAIENQRFRVFFESQSYRVDWLTPPQDSEQLAGLPIQTNPRYANPSFWVFMDPVTNTQVHTFACWLFDIYKPVGSDVYVPVDGTVTIHYNEVVSIPWWSKVYYNRTGALHSLGAFNHGFDCVATLYPPMNPVDYASWMEGLDFTPEGITCYGTNTSGKWRILVNGIKKDEWSEDKLLAASGNLLLQRYGENYSHYNLLLRPKFNRRTDVFQAWVNGFSEYYSCLARGTATIEVRDVDTGITNTYNLESLGSETQGLDNEAAVAAALWKMKDGYNIWKAVYKVTATITPTHKGYNVQDFRQELGTQSYIPMPEQIWLQHGLMPKIKYATATNTPNPQLFWARNGILDNGIGVSYGLEVATDSTFANLVFVKTQIPDENYHLTDINLEEGIYYWRVRVEDEYLPGNLQNALPKLYSPGCRFEIRLAKQAGITVVSDPTTQEIPSDVIVGIYDKEGSIYTGAYWIEYDQINRTKTLDLKYTPITVHFEALREGGKSKNGGVIVPPDYIFREGSCVHIFENGVIFNEPGTYAVSISISGEGINIPSVSHSGIQVVPKGIVPDHFHVVDILDPIEKGGTSNVSVVVHDANCNLVIGYTGSIHFTSTDPLAILPQTYTFTAADYGVNTFVDGVVLKTPGSQTVFAIDVNNPQITGSQTVTVEGTVEDTVAPTILHEPIAFAPAGLPMIIMATITDKVKVEQAILYWKVGGTKTIGSAQMVNMGHDLYLGTISETDVTMRGLQYYLWATDGKNATSTTTWITLTYGTATSGKIGAVKPKWKSISVPIYPHNPDPASVLWNWGEFEKNVSLKYFDGTTWIIHNPPLSMVPDFAPELGLMISADKNREIIVCGTSTNPAGYHVIKLTGGGSSERQNHIGQPYLYPVMWDNNVLFKRGDKLLNPVQAQKKGWIKKSLSYYAGSGYKKVPYPGVMYPWVGYILPVLLDCEMLIPAEEVGAGLKPGTGLKPGSGKLEIGNWKLEGGEGIPDIFHPLTPASGGKDEGEEESESDTLEQGEWVIQLMARAGSLTDEFNFAGVRQGATARYDDEDDLTEMPLLTDSELFPFYYVHLFFTSPTDDKYADDYRGKEAKVWECVVENKDEVEEPVELSWVLSQVPEQYYVYLKDKVTENTVDMKKTAGYKFVGQKRQFSLSVTTQPMSVIPSTLTLESAYCYPNPTNKGELTFVLPSVKVTIQIFNIAGEKVFEKITSGGNWPWGCINSAGEKVASGIYIYILNDGITTRTGKLGIIK